MMKWTALAAGLMVVGCGAPDPTAAVQDISGAYARTEPSRGELLISREGAGWRVSLVAGGLPNGMATATDCYAEAVGTLTGDTLTAQLVPVANEDMTVDQAILDATPHGPLVIRFSGAAAALMDNGAANFCGVGSDVGGLYTKAG